MREKRPFAEKKKKKGGRVIGHQEKGWSPGKTSQRNERKKEGGLGVGEANSRERT